MGRFDYISNDIYNMYLKDLCYLVFQSFDFEHI